MPIPGPPATSATGTPLSGFPLEVVTRIRAGVVSDPYSGESAESWADGDVDLLDITALAPPEPRPSSEPVQEARNAVVSGWTLYLPPGADVTSADRVSVRGRVFPVQGEPADWGVGLVVQAFTTEG